MDREIEEIVCSCGGEVEEMETTSAEELGRGCGRKGCCVRAYECRECKARFIFYLAAPETISW